MVDPTQRYDARQALAHEWFRVEVPTGNNRGLGSVIHELRTFNNQRKGIIKQGYLSKQGHIIRNWKKRSFVLMRDELRYYKSETEKKPQGKIEIGTIVTYVYSVSLVHHGLSSSSSFSFSSSSSFSFSLTIIIIILLDNSIHSSLALKTIPMMKMDLLLKPIQAKTTRSMLSV